jgi:hypothetical protein
MASAAGVAGVRATLDLGSKSSKRVQCGSQIPRGSRTIRKLPAVFEIRTAKRRSVIYRRVVQSVGPVLAPGGSGVSGEAGTVIAAAAKRSPWRVAGCVEGMARLSADSPINIGSETL